MAKRKQGGEPTSNLVLSTHHGSRADMMAHVLAMHAPPGAVVAQAGPDTSGLGSDLACVLLDLTSATPEQCADACWAVASRLGKKGVLVVECPEHDALAHVEIVAGCELLGLYCKDLFVRLRPPSEVERRPGRVQIHAVVLVFVKRRVSVRNVRRFAP